MSGLKKCTCHFLPFATKARKFRGANRQGKHRTAITDKGGEMVNFYELCHGSERELAALCVHCRDRGGLSGQRLPHFDELISCNGGLRERARSGCLSSVCFGKERGWDAVWLVWKKKRWLPVEQRPGREKRGFLRTLLWDCPLCLYSQPWDVLHVLFEPFE